MLESKKQKLIILSVNYEPYMSGAEQMVREILERLGGRYKTTLLTARFDRALPPAEERKNFKIIRLGIGHKTIDKFLYPVLAALKARSLKPDIAHAVMESYAGGALALIKYLYPRAKRILTLQSGDLDDPRKQKQLILKLVWKKIHTSPHKITAISSFLAERAENLGVARENISVTPNGINFSEVPENVVKISNRVVCVARLSWEKSHCLMLEAWPSVLREFPDAKLVFVGEGPERKRIEALIKKLGIANSVNLTGNLAHKQALIELKKSEIFICPSLAEGLGNVFIEAQACGVPPIGTRVGGIPDVIQDGENGILIEPKNPEAIAGAIIKLLTDKELAARLKNRGLVTSKKYEWSSVTENIDNIYKELLK